MPIVHVPIFTKERGRLLSSLRGNAVKRLARRLELPGVRRVQVKVQIHRQTSRWLRTKPRLRVWNEQYDRRRKVKVDLRRFGFILCVLLGWIFVRIKKKKKRKGERKTKRALFFLLWNVASSSSCLLDCTRALLIILSIATTHTAHI